MITKQALKGAPAIQTMSFVGSYVPRQCGIATFTKDLHDSVASEIGATGAAVVAMDDVAGGYLYPDEVRFQIPAHKPGPYRVAAHMLNINQIDVVVVQHEYGIYGGSDGDFVLDLIHQLRMPVITTLHTVLKDPSDGQRRVMLELIESSDRVVVMSHLAESILQEVYQAPPDKIAYVPHGIPDVPFVDPNFFKDQFAVEGRTVLLTFGLLGPSKGIETAIEALPKIVAQRPDVVYIVLGATHPHIFKREGNAYRHSLERLADSLGVRSHVLFHNRFVSIDELCGYIGSADVYLTPYPNAAQITSGTLAYALGAGKAVVSTPFWHAQELLAEGRGRMFDFGSSGQLADAVLEILAHDKDRHTMRKRAYLYGRKMIWKQVARDYLQLANDIVQRRRQQPRTVTRAVLEPVFRIPIPELNLAHLRRLTDGTGIFQHAVCSVPDRRHGYCTDDNARALVAAVAAFKWTQDEKILELMDIYLSFMHHAFGQTSGWFRNFMKFDRRWIKDSNNQDVHGRAIWALGVAAQMAPNDAVLSFTTRLFHQALGRAESINAPRAQAFTLIGLRAYLERFDGDTHARRVRNRLADDLLNAFSNNAGENWPWIEDQVTYDNGKLPHALIASGRQMDRQDMIARGLEVLLWLVDTQTRDDGTVCLIGNDGWLTRDGHRARFDQQPLEAMAMIEACAEAYRCTLDPSWVKHAQRFLTWFTGNNESGSVLYDYQTGGCRDGLHADGANLNEGAESTLAWLISLLTIMQLPRADGSDPPALPPAGAGPAVASNATDGPI